MIEKARDALSMLWLNLDDRERRLIVGAGVWVAATVWVVVGEELKRRDREKVKAEIRGELLRELKAMIGGTHA